MQPVDALLSAVWHRHVCVHYKPNHGMCAFTVTSPRYSGVYGPKKDFGSVSADDMLEVYSVNCVGPLLVVQQLLKAGLIGGPGGKTLVGNVSSKVGPCAGVAVGPGWRGTGYSSADQSSAVQCSADCSRPAHVIAWLLLPSAQAAPWLQLQPPSTRPSMHPCHTARPTATRPSPETAPV